MHRKESVIFHSSLYFARLHASSLLPQGVRLEPHSYLPAHHSSSRRPAENYEDVLRSRLQPSFRHPPAGTIILRDAIQSYIRSPKPSLIVAQIAGHNIISSGTREHSRSTAAIPESIFPLPAHRTCIRASNASGEIPRDTISDTACPSRIDRNRSA